MERIVVGIDGSDESAAALRWAVHEADLHGATVVALHAWGYVAQMHPNGGPTFDAHYGVDEAAASLSQFVDKVLTDEESAKVEQRVVCDLATRTLLDASTDADLLVVGARVLGGFHGLVLGSVSQQCLHHATVPVCIVKHQDELAPHTRIVVGVDGSATFAGRALEWAVGEARARHAELEVVHTWQAPVTAAYPYAVQIDPTPYETGAAELVRDMIGAVDTEGVPKVIASVDYGSAVEAMLGAAQHAQLVVVGTRGVGGFRGMIMGSVCHGVAHHAPCPVIVIPAEQTDDAAKS